ncbi:MAG: hypothetical protein ACREMU_01450, partial [Gemmatimonadaceae bacterium]
ERRNYDLSVSHAMGAGGIARHAAHNRTAWHGLRAKRVPGNEQWDESRQPSDLAMQLQTALVFVPPYPLHVLRRMKSRSSKRTLMSP